MSETKQTYAISTEQMQVLANADAVFADLAMEAMVTGSDKFQLYAGVGLPLFELQHAFVEAGLAEAVLDRSDR